MLNRGLIVCLVLMALAAQSNGQSWKDKYVQAQDAYSKESYDQAFTLADESFQDCPLDCAASAIRARHTIRPRFSISFFFKRLKNTEFGLIYQGRP